MPVITKKHVLGLLESVDTLVGSRVIAIDPQRLNPSPFSQSIYGEVASEIEDLSQSIRQNGILVPLVVTPDVDSSKWEVVSGHRRLACALALGLPAVPCEVRGFASDAFRRLAVLEYNRQRQKTFSQTMREADALEALWENRARARRLANLRRGQFEQKGHSNDSDCRISDDRAAAAGPNLNVAQKVGDEKSGRGRTDERIARAIGIGGKDLYRQARAVWQLAEAGDLRAQNGVAQLDERHEDHLCRLQGLASS